MAATIKTGGRSHRIHYLGGGVYLLSWSYDIKIKGSRLRWPRTMTRDTDRKGAERFAERWGCRIPEES